jgi:TetR/AcrR family transcriptional regulator, ethionamide resistance regulator
MARLSRRSDDTAEPAAPRALLDAATELLEEGAPFGDLSVEAIARRAGFSRATFYAHFRDKRALLFQLAERIEHELYAQTAAWLEAGVGDLRETIAAVLEVLRRRRAVFGALVEAATYDEEVARLWRDLHARFAEVARDRILRDQPGVGVEAAEARAFALVWMTERVLFEHVVEPRVDEEALLEAVAQLAEAGLRP